MLPRRSSSVCSFTSLFRRRNFPHGKSDRHKSIVVESRALHGLGQLHAERFVAVEVASGGNQDLCKIGVDPPVAMLVGVCQRVARNLAPEAHMIELGLLVTKTSFDIAEAFAIGELSKGQTEELIPAGEIFDVAIALVAIDANLKLVGWEEVHELRENGSAKIHLLPPKQAGKQ